MKLEGLQVRYGKILNLKTGHFAGHSDIEFCPWVLTMLQHCYSIRCYQFINMLSTIFRFMTFYEKQVTALTIF